MIAGLCVLMKNCAFGFNFRNIKSKFSCQFGCKYVSGLCRKIKLCGYLFNATVQNSIFNNSRSPCDSEIDAANGEVTLIRLPVLLSTRTSFIFLHG